MTRIQPRQDEQPRGLLFHWVANILLATLAVFSGVLFGERIPRNRLGLLAAAVMVAGLLLIPLTRRWERAGIRKRQADAQAQGDDPPKEPDA